MPIYDFVCPKCKSKKNDVFTKSWEEIIKCDCGTKMNKKPSIMVPYIFPADGIFLEHVSPEGKLFRSKKEMKAYAKANDLELGALE